MKLTLFILCSIACLSFSTTAEAQHADSKRTTQDSTIAMGDAQLRFTVSYGSQFMESNFQSHQHEFPELTAVPWMVTVDGKTVTPTGDETKLINIPSDKGGKVVFTGEVEDFTWRLAYHASGLGRITKSFSLTPKRDLRLEVVTLWDAHTASSPVVSRTGLQDIAAFYRNDSSGMFVSLDFP